MEDNKSLKGNRRTKRKRVLCNEVGAENSLSHDVYPSPNLIVEGTQSVCQSSCRGRIASRNLMFGNLTIQAPPADEGGSNLYGTKHKPALQDITNQLVMNTPQHNQIPASEVIINDGESRANLIGGEDLLQDHVRSVSVHSGSANEVGSSDIERYILKSREHADKIMSTLNYPNDVLTCTYTTPVRNIQVQVSDQHCGDVDESLGSVSNLARRYAVISPRKGQRVSYRSVNQIVRQLSKQFMDSPGECAEGQDISKVDDVHPTYEVVTNFKNRHSPLSPTKSKRFRCAYTNITLMFYEVQLQSSEIQNLGLIEIERILRRCGRSFREFTSMPQPQSEQFMNNTNSLIVEQLNFNNVKQDDEFRMLESSMTEEQKVVFDGIMSSVASGQGII
ncbi:hypothetical protein RIF29_38969 [Crotalaria pallida]|uniref:Uncharacterized protein n=1 Tax=Crotalaria pallida TaxID=3830 RepID=A0AAN9E242_CROPI